MVFLWALLILALLWLWLSGHWFGRGLMLTVLVGFGVLLLTASERQGAQIIGAVIALASWPIASAPAWVWLRLQGPHGRPGRM
jgi:hypothetical protein